MSNKASLGAFATHAVRSETRSRDSKRHLVREEWRVEADGPLYVSSGLRSVSTEMRSVCYPSRDVRFAVKISAQKATVEAEENAPITSIHAELTSEVPFVLNGVTCLRDPPRAVLGHLAAVGDWGP